MTREKLLQLIFGISKLDGVLSITYNIGDIVLFTFVPTTVAETVDYETWGKRLLYG